MRLIILWSWTERMRVKRKRIDSDDVGVYEQIQAQNRGLA
jgi:hypothetical protein